ncbi:MULTISPECIES: chloride channel protein [unclassified Streptomyces]|uniref:chloride channel protein n=1 Tax=unclassified Streptomyces TaxID=2593676 RepID=UPI0008856A2F|nr:MULTISPECIES: chloride channel protein [unclassified Streptomyces]PBC80801.1 H+/Cl- antiporter ClcA [Streptomyces sp. 2321.6]SDR57259.1 H+/Cl-antiporter ClcA [Streptomyces sp. KS_16]SEB89086.1 H+/Cl-antiporter ClcA [Streptomyces sp. 2133.1]SNC62225.1 H+/Cl- antiporter ClcA [Streptomyces sp. 2114.4]
MSADSTGPAGETPATVYRDPYALVRTRGYLKLLLVAAVVGFPVCAVAFGFLALVHELEPLIYTDLPRALGLAGTPLWWPVPMLVVAGLLVGLAIRHLPGNGGHEPADGLALSGAPPLSALPGIVFAALASLSFGAVLGPEAPLIALGGGLAAGAARLLGRGLNAQSVAAVGAAGSFAAVSALLGSPLLGAFLLMEVAGLGGPMLGMLLVPGLLAAGIGALVFTGLGDWTGLGTYSLALHDVPPAAQPTVPEFGWALVIGVAAAFVATGVRRLSLFLKGRVVRHRVPATMVMGLVVGALAVVFAAATGKPATEMLYSGQSALGSLFRDSAGYSVAALLLLIVCKGLAYCASLSAFRGGPIFPALFLGAAGGVVLAHLPGLSLTPAFAMGVGAMCVAMLRLPMTSVLLATLLLGKSGLTVMPLVIVAVVVAYVVVLRLTPATGAPAGGAPAGDAPAGGAPAPAPHTA